ncbi:MAG: hypothetical protein R2854_15095 [Caldilineaceae bacterium]
MPLACVLLGTFFLAVPRELEEAAMADGANHRQIFSSTSSRPSPCLRVGRHHHLYPGLERVLYG